MQFVNKQNKDKVLQSEFFRIREQCSLAARSISFEKQKEILKFFNDWYLKTNVRFFKDVYDIGDKCVKNMNISGISIERTYID